MLECIFSRRLRTAATILWVVGASLAGITAPVAAVQLDVVSSLPFVTAAAGLVFLAIGTSREARLALFVTVVLLGAQPLGVIGSAWELFLAGETVKTRQLKSLGLDPTLGIVVNLAYSAIASLLFALVVMRWRRCRWDLTTSGEAQNPRRQERR